MLNIHINIGVSSSPSSRVHHMYTVIFTAMSDLLSSQPGSVRPYTRHAKTCKAAKDDNSCWCAKWLYSFNKHTGLKRRRSLETPSWAEAEQRAKTELKNMNPKIAPAEALTAKKEASLVTVADACQLWVDRAINKFGDDCLNYEKLPGPENIRHKLVRP